MSSVIFWCMSFLVVLRWAHLLTTCSVRPADEYVSPRPRDKDWPAVGLGLLYGIAFAAWLLCFLDRFHVTEDRSSFACGLLALGVLLRLVGQSAIGSAFSWYWTPKSSMLVTAGIYRWLKHPLLLGYLLETAAFSVGAPIPVWACGLLIAATVILIGIQAAGEEQRLKVKFGDAWSSYAARKLV